jgi:Cft2 family RNA processing exonuclease
MNGFSAHADLPELLWFVSETRKKSHLKRVFLVHGEEAALMNLKTELADMGVERIDIPDVGSEYELP